MKIYLNDASGKIMTLDMKVEFSLPMTDLMVVFYLKNQTCTLYNGKESASYNLHSRVEKL